MTPNTIVKKSLIDGVGNGVFANKDFTIGDVVCIYDGEHVSKYCYDTCSPEEYMYSVRVPSANMHILGYKDNYKEDYCGQIINDVATIDLSNLDIDTHDGYYDVKDWSGAVGIRSQKYFSVVCQKINVVFDTDPDIPIREREFPLNSGKIKDDFKGKDLQIICCRNISKGDELYVSYGAHYWLKLYCKTQLDIIKRFHIFKNITNPDYGLPELHTMTQSDGFYFCDKYLTYKDLFVDYLGASSDDINQISQKSDFKITSRLYDKSLYYKLYVYAECKQLGDEYMMNIIISGMLGL
jgi:hypothetical protein